MVRGSITLILLALGMPSLAAAETMSFGDSIGMLAKSCGAADWRALLARIETARQSIATGWNALVKQTEG